MHSISVAALIYTVAKNCSRGEIQGCGCKHFREIGDNDKVSTKMSDCQEQVEFSERVANEIFDQNNQPQMDAQGYALFHNKRAAQIVSKSILIT